MCALKSAYDIMRWVTCSVWVTRLVKPES